MSLSNQCATVSLISKLSLCDIPQLLEIQAQQQISDYSNIICNQKSSNAESSSMIFCSLTTDEDQNKVLKIC
ncbi:MAG: hypothetical protein V7L29_32055 [Nostoc sp.]|uniref:hypothetical protein n=1 Tax=Nostoc sp. TaxID=1180 RepID=UPI002FF5BC1D